MVETELGGGARLRRRHATLVRVSCGRSAIPNTPPPLSLSPSPLPSVGSDRPPSVAALAWRLGLRPSTAP